MLRTLIVLLALSFAGCNAARAGLPETPQPIQLTVDDGLPSNRINGIAQDAAGYLWIATSDGLARYDGIGYRIWRVGQGLDDNFVWAVHVDAHDRVWVGTRAAGLAMLDVDRTTFRYFDRAHDPRIGSDDVWTINSTPDGALWFGTADGGLHRMATDGRITRYMPRPGDEASLPDAGVGQLAVAPKGALWVGTKNGVARWTGHGFERLSPAALNSRAINGLRFDSDGALWIGTPRGVSRLAPDGSASLRPWPRYAKTVFHMLLRDSAGHRWLDSADGMSRDSEGEVRNVPLYSDTSHGAIRPSWSSAYEDREGGLWFASSDSGLWYLQADWSRFSVLARLADDPSSPANAYVHGISPSASANMWLVGSGGVLDLLDPESGRIEHVVDDIGDGYMPMGVHEDRHGRVWVSYYDGLARYDPATGELKRWSADAATDAALPSARAWFAETSEGMLWLASEQDGLQVRDREGHVVESIRADDSQGLQRNRLLRQVGIGPDGAVWVAGVQGLLMWNDGERRFEPVPGAPVGDVHGFASKDGTVWLIGFGTLGQYRWSGAGLVLVNQFDQAQGLPKLAPSGLTVDRAGLVWITSVRGLIRFDPVQRTTRIYGVRDGLPSQEFGESPVQRPQDGRIAAATPDGLVLFDPAAVRPADTTSKLVLESIGVQRGDQRVALSPAKAIEIAYDDRDLRIVARLLSFNNARSHRFRFRLEPYDAQWVETGSSGERVFSRLEPGHYTLRILGVTADNMRSPEYVMSLRVQPPWWRTAWARIIFALIAIGLLWKASSDYRRRLKRRNAWQLSVHKRELAEQASLAKTRFLATLGHEVRTPMTGVLGMSELLLGTGLDEKQRGYTESIRNAGDHLMRLVNDALDLARIEAGKLELDAQPFDLQALVRDVVALMAPVARQRGLGFEDDIAADVPSWLRGDAGRIRQILLNLLGNAIKFTDSGQVALRIERSPEGLRFIVSDTGPGLNAEQKQRLFRRFEQAEGARTSARYGGSGLGLAICQELAAAMDGRIDVDSEPGQGTRFTVDLPLPVAAAPATDPGTQSTASTSTRGALDLLLVEDDPTVAEVVTGLLHAQGHRVVHAAHGLAALAESSGKHFDMALLDLDLPGIDGFALAGQLRAQGFAQPLLAVTARADADAEPLAREAGFDGFLRKPLTGKMLAEAIEGLMPDTAGA
jgi:signal transduction histidine kinase/sugar lactone lactonase YvrE/ActR/RegA family two-component response regulator